MRVLQLNKRSWPHVGGIERHLADLMHGLAHTPGVEVRALVCGERGEVAGRDGPPPGVERVRSFGTVWSLPLAPGYPAALRRGLRRGPSVVHLHEPFPLGALSWLLASARGGAPPLVVTWHSDIVRQRAALPVYGPVLRRVLRRAGAVIVPTERHITASRFLPAVAERCRVIPFGIDAGRYESPAARGAGEALRRALGGERIVLFVGRLVYYKGLPVLIRAMRDVPGRLVLVGEGPDRVALERLAVAVGVSSRVRFAGQVADAELPAYYQACDVFVLPSTAVSEGFGIVQLEAMASGRPVVSTSLPTGLSTVGVDGETGLQVPVGDVDSLAGALARLLESPGVATEMGEAARRRVKERYTAGAMVRSTLDLYRQVVATGGVAATGAG